jgi:hypothetical protein
MTTDNEVKVTETWEARSTREAAERVAEYHAFRAMASEVGEALGGWIVQSETEDPTSYWNPAARLVKDGFGLYLQEDRGRLEITGGSWPTYTATGKYAATVTQTVRPSSLGQDTGKLNITVALSRGPAATAKAISSRLLPEYTRVWNACKVLADKRVAAEAQKATGWAEVCKVTGTTPSQRWARITTTSGILVNIEEHYGCARFTLDLTASQLTLVIAALGGQTS